MTKSTAKTDGTCTINLIEAAEKKLRDCSWLSSHPCTMKTKLQLQARINVCTNAPQDALSVVSDQISPSLGSIDSSLQLFSLPSSTMSTTLVSPTCNSLRVNVAALYHNKSVAGAKLSGSCLELANGVRLRGLCKTPSSPTAKNSSDSAKLW
jgi:hypothetical protein